MRLNKIRKYVCLTSGCLILAFGLYNVHARCPVSEGGVLGLSLLIYQWTGISPGVSSLAINTAAFGLGIAVFGLRFLADSMFCAAAYSGWYTLMELTGPVLPDLSEQPFAAAAVGAVFVGIGCGLIVRYDCAASGDDALALVCNRLSGVRVSVFYFFSDLTVLILSLSYIPAKQIVWSLLTVTLSSLIIELFRPRMKN